MNEQKIERVSFTRRYLDRMRNPPEYVDEELPTKTVKIFKRKQQGTAIDSSLGDLNFGSIQFTGSYYSFSQGSYSLRITRHTIGVGSPGGPGAQLWWKLRHSQLGTVDAIPMDSARGQIIRDKAPMEPLYSFGSGIVTQYLRSLKGTWRIASSLEGIFS